MIGSITTIAMVLLFAVWLIADIKGVEDGELEARFG